MSRVLLVGGRAPETAIKLQLQLHAKVRSTHIYDLFSVEYMYAVQFMTPKLIQLLSCRNLSTSH